jgi:predicted transcriptional regulator
MPLIKRPWTDQEVALVFAMRDAGKPLYLIANKVGRTKRAVQHIFRSKRGMPSNVETDA